MVTNLYSFLIFVIIIYWSKANGNDEIVSSFHTSKTNKISVNLPHQLPSGNTAMRWEIVNVEDNRK